jgi:Mrp family chromosome partitioning ATPase
MSDDVSSPQSQYKADGDDQDFIPNPRYRAGLPAENVEEQLWRLSRSDAAEHFELASRGIEVGEKGWFFAGRKRLLGSLVDWLSTAEHGVRIVTGPPGAGKSAVMGRLATLSDAQYRQGAIDAGVVKEGEDIIAPVGAIDVAVHQGQDT